MLARYHITTPFGIVSPLVWALVMERCPFGSYLRGFGCGLSARRQILAVGSNADAGAIPEDQRKAHENAFVVFQTEVIFSRPSCSQCSRGIPCLAGRKGHTSPSNPGVSRGCSSSDPA